MVPALFLTTARGRKLCLSPSFLPLPFTIRPSRLILSFFAPLLGYRSGAFALQVLEGGQIQIC
jgi:hypothetical protein